MKIIFNIFVRPNLMCIKLRQFSSKKTPGWLNQLNKKGKSSVGLTNPANFTPSATNNNNTNNNAVTPVWNGTVIK